LPEERAVVSPDAGRVRLATAYARRLGAPVIVLHKRRESGRETAVTHVVGDVRDRACLIINDIIATGGTIAESVRALRAAGAQPDVMVAATHGLFVAGALDTLTRAGVQKVFVTDTASQTVANRSYVQIVSVAPLLAAALRRFMTDGSISDLY
jgi:ribose-phosphate pyrophosphokinase